MVDVYPNFHEFICFRQVEGKDGLSKLLKKVRTIGPTTLFHGSLAAAAATFVGHYPW